MGDESVEAAGLGGGVKEGTGNCGRPVVGNKRELILGDSWGGTLGRAGSGEHVGRKGGDACRRHDSMVGNCVYLGDTCGRCHPCKGSGNNLKAMDNSILCGRCREREVGMAEFDCIGDNLTIGVSID